MLIITCCHPCSIRGSFFLLAACGTARAKLQAAIGPVPRPDRQQCLHLKRASSRPGRKKGLRVVWHKQLGTGYGAPVISQGKLLPIRSRRRIKRACFALMPAPANLSGSSTYPTRLQGLLRLQQRPALLPRRRSASACSSTVPRGCCTASAPTTASSLWNVDTRVDFNVVQNFFGVGSTPVVEGDLLIVQVGGSPKGSVHAQPRRHRQCQERQQRRRRLRIATASVKYRISDELGQLFKPGARDHRRPTLVLRVRPRRVCWPLNRPRARSTSIFPGAVKT